MSRSTAAERAALESRRVHRVYEILARVYDGCFDWALGPGRRSAISRLPIREGDRILEVGVGTGLSLPQYPENCRLTGVDISEAMLDQARERADALGRGDVDLRVMDARELKWADETFDHVLAPYVISVVPEPKRVMDEIRRVCKRGGTIMIVNHFRSPNGLLRMCERALTPASRWIGFRLDEPLETATCSPGLEVVSIERVNLLGLWRQVELRRLD